MDGVLTDSEPLINSAAVAMFREKGLEVQPADFLPFVGTGENRYLGGVAEKHAFPLEIEAAKKRTYELYLELVPAQLKAFPGAVDLIRRCRDSGLKVAVASSADWIKIEANLRQIGVPPEQWDAIVSGEDVVHKKPAPDIFLAAARKLGLEPGQCVVVEDAINGVQAARAAQMRCVAVAQSFPADQLTAADLVRPRIADVSLGDLTGLAGRMPPPLVPPPTISRPTPSGPDAPSLPVRPLGFWSTSALSLLIALGHTAAQVVALVPVVALLLWQGHRPNLDDLATNGLVLSLATAVSLPATVGLCWLFSRLARGIPAREYLAVRPVRWRALLGWTGVLLLVLVVTGVLASALGQPSAPESVITVYRTAGFLPLLIFAMVVAAPFQEELFFRGFMFTGYARSWMGPGGAILVSAALWALIHLQYDWFTRGVIFLAGLVLGVARWRTGSVYTPIFLHMVMNAVATVEIAMISAANPPVPTEGVFIVLR